MKQLTALPHAFWGKLFLALIAATFLSVVPALAQPAVPQKPAAPAAQAAPPATPAPDQAKEREAFAIGVEAYIYGYPLVTMEMTRRVMTNVVAPAGNHAPMGQFHNSKTYPDASFRDVTAPNADTLYSTAWLDLAKEPYVLSLPDEHGRYYLMPMLDGWTSVFQVPGQRTTGTKAQKYAITGPGWKGTLPQGVTEYKSPTNMVWISGPDLLHRKAADYQAVHKIQSQYKLVPLSAYGKSYTPPPGQVGAASIDMKTPVREQVNGMEAAACFSCWVALLKDNPPAAADAPMVAKLAKIGIVPGQDFDLSKVDPAVAKGLEGVPKAAGGKDHGQFQDHGHRRQWLGNLPEDRGLRHRRHLDRALVTAIGLGANRPQDAVYPTTEADVDGKPYDGAHKYVMHFDKGQLPPVKGFWSLTMYNADYLCGQPAEPLHAEQPEQVHVQSGRVGGSLHPE